MSETKYQAILDLNKLHEEELEKKKQEDDDQNFIKKDEPQEEQTEEQTEEKSQSKETEQPKVQGFFGKLFNKIFPKANQSRNLDNEVGGLEAKERKESHEKDVWDDRSEEVDKMAKNVFQTTGMKSVVWKQKKARLDAKKIAKHSVNAVEAKSEMKKVTNQQGIAASSFDNQGFVARLRNLRQDRTTTFGKDEGGRGF